MNLWFHHTLGPQPSNLLLLREVLQDSTDQKVLKLSNKNQALCSKHNRAWQTTLWNAFGEEIDKTCRVHTHNAKAHRWNVHAIPCHKHLPVKHAPLTSQTCLNKEQPSGFRRAWTRLQYHDQPTLPASLSLASPSPPASHQEKGNGCALGSN